MKNADRFGFRTFAAACCLTLLLCLANHGVSALSSSGSLGLEATIPSPPPSHAATIAIPSSGQTFTSIPITISGLCQSNLLIKAFSNNVFTGSAICSGGSYSLKVDLFNGNDALYVQEFDSLGQGGPLSNTVNVVFLGVQGATSLSPIVISTKYATEGADPGQQLVWPLTITGGTPPYAISTNWGDGQQSTLQSVTSGEQVYIKHVYNTSGVYTVTVTATDVNGATGFLQLVGIANGQINSTGTNNSGPSSTNGSGSSLKNGNNASGYWWAYALVALALIPAFWLGNRHGRAVLLKKYK